MLNRFREDLEQLLYDYAQVGVKLDSISYDVADTFYFDKEKDKVVSFKDIENVEFSIKVTNGS